MIISDHPPARTVRSRASVFYVKARGSIYIGCPWHLMFSQPFSILFIFLQGGKGSSLVTPLLCQAPFRLHLSYVENNRRGIKPHYPHYVLLFVKFIYLTDDYIFPRFIDVDRNRGRLLSRSYKPFFLTNININNNIY